MLVWGFREGKDSESWTRVLQSRELQRMWRRVRHDIVSTHKTNEWKFIDGPGPATHMENANACMRTNTMSVFGGCVFCLVLDGTGGKIDARSHLAVGFWPTAGPVRSIHHQYIMLINGSTCSLANNVRLPISCRATDSAEIPEGEGVCSSILQYSSSLERTVHSMQIRLI